MFYKRNLMLADGEMLKERRSFLQHVARLDGVNFRLIINGAKKDAMKKAFVHDLEALIQEMTFKRSYLGDEAVSIYTCRKRLLSESYA